MKTFEEYSEMVQYQIKAAGGLEAWRKDMSRRAKMRKTFKGGFSDPEFARKAQQLSVQKKLEKRNNNGSSG